MTKYIHVNQHKIRSNLKHGTLEPVILGPSKVVYGEEGEKLLNCGARVVIETDSDINIVR